MENIKSKKVKIKITGTPTETSLLRISLAKHLTKIEYVHSNEDIYIHCPDYLVLADLFEKIEKKYRELNNLLWLNDYN